MESSRILKMSISNAVINVLKIDTRNILDHIVKAYLLLEFVIGDFSN